MSLLEKAQGGARSARSSRVRGAGKGKSSLFAKAMAASGADAASQVAEPPIVETAILPVPAETPIQLEPIVSTELPEASSRFESGILASLRQRISELPAELDSMLAAWHLLSGSLGLSALALYLPEGELMGLAASYGFPAAEGESLPPSIAPAEPGATLSRDSQAILSQALGLALDARLRAAGSWSSDRLAAVWIYLDAGLEAAPFEEREKLGELFASSGSAFSAPGLAAPSGNPVVDLLAAARPYAFASVFRFDLLAIEGSFPETRWASSSMLSSIVLAACAKILASSGAAFCFGTRSIACVLGSNSPLDIDLALFHFSKTIKRLLPFAAPCIPPGRALAFEPSGEGAPTELAAFLSD
jgi:hypothetical protein